MRWVLILVLSAVWLSAQWCEQGRVAELNSQADEFAPVWDPRERHLLLSSTRGGVSRIYTARWYDTVWGNPEELGGLGAAGHHLSYAAPSPDGWLYLCRYWQGKRQAYLHIVRARRDARGAWEWQELPELHVGAEEAFSAHPTVSPDGRMLVFASDRPGGQGGTDLWIAYRQPDGRWSEPENLRALNSPGNEITPRFASPDTLYFASDGHGGAGGYDLFMSVRRWDGSWQPPEPLVELNTEMDESDFCVLPFGDLALFVRARGGERLKLYAARRCPGVSGPPVRSLPWE